MDLVDAASVPPFRIHQCRADRAATVGMASGAVEPLAKLRALVHVIGVAFEMAAPRIGWCWQRCARLQRAHAYRVGRRRGGRAMTGELAPFAITSGACQKKPGGLGEHRAALSALAGRKHTECL